jgi:hypothetical protein
LALSYWRGGFFDKNVTASQLSGGDPDSNFIIANKTESTRFETDFFTVSYGFALANGLKLGIGAIYAQTGFNYSLFQQIFDPNDPNNPIGTTDVSTSETGTGFGGQLGLIGAIGEKGNWGLSYRSEFKLHDFGDGEQFADTIPAKLAFGVSYLLSEVARGKSKDYLVGAFQFDHYFSANSGLADERKEVTNFGMGMQYSLSQRSFTVPVRLGYRSYQAADTNLFSNESIFTFGFGYRPLSEHWAVDLDFGKSNRHSGLDFSLSLGWQFGQD